MRISRNQSSLLLLLFAIAIAAGIGGWQIRRHAAERRSAVRLQLLELYANSLRKEYRAVRLLYQAMARGGQASIFYNRGAELCLANADLAFEKRDRAAGIEHLKEGLRFAYECLAAASVSYAYGPESDEPTVVEAAALKCKIELRLADESPEADQQILGEWMVQQDVSKNANWDLTLYDPELPNDKPPVKDSPSR